jgi:hypothetical protein
MENDDNDDEEDDNREQDNGVMDEEIDAITDQSEE